MISKEYRSRGGLALYTAVFVFAAPAVLAKDDAAKVARLSLEAHRLEDRRAGTKLQITYAHYLQFGLWCQAASRFTDNAEMISAGNALKVRSSIGKYFLNNWGSS